MKTAFKFGLFIIGLWFARALPVSAQPPTRPTTATGEPFTIEGYYKVKWGYADEFLDLYEKNHLSLLKKAREKGDVLKIIVEKPRFHATEDSRWDYRVTLVFKNM